jgi:hypothetical protein
MRGHAIVLLVCMSFFSPVYAEIVKVDTGISVYLNFGVRKKQEPDNPPFAGAISTFKCTIQDPETGDYTITNPAWTWSNVHVAGSDDGLLLSGKINHTIPKVRFTRDDVFTSRVRYSINFRCYFSFTYGGQNLDTAHFRIDAPHYDFTYNGDVLVSGAIPTTYIVPAGNFVFTHDPDTLYVEDTYIPPPKLPDVNNLNKSSADGMVSINWVAPDPDNATTAALHKGYILQISAHETKQTVAKCVANPSEPTLFTYTFSKSDLASAYVPYLTMAAFSKKKLWFRLCITQTDNQITDGFQDSMTVKLSDDLALEAEAKTMTLSYPDPVNYSYNWYGLGLGEKWFKATIGGVTKNYYITNKGLVYKWNGGPRNQTGQSADTLVYNFGPGALPSPVKNMLAMQVYYNPTFLKNGFTGGLLAEWVSLDRTLGMTRPVNHNYSLNYLKKGEKWIRLRRGTGNMYSYILPNGTWYTNTSGSNYYVTMVAPPSIFTNLHKVCIAEEAMYDYAMQLKPNSGTTLTNPASTANAKWFRAGSDPVTTNWYYLLPTGFMYRSSTGVSINQPNDLYLGQFPTLDYNDALPLVVQQYAIP